MFDKAHFLSHVNFAGAHFLSERDWATFAASIFDFGLTFDGAEFKNQAHFAEALISGTRQRRSTALISGETLPSKTPSSVEVSFSKRQSSMASRVSRERS